MRTFGENLRRIRRRLRLSQSALVRRLGSVSHTTISYWETHSAVPRPETIIRIAEALGCEPKALLDNVETPYDLLRSRGFSGLAFLGKPLESCLHVGPAMVKTVGRLPSALPSAHSPARIGIFRCDSTLNVARIDGDIAERLDCDRRDLEVYGWKPYVHSDSQYAIREMAVELAAGCAGRYELQAVSRSRERLHLRIRTFLVRSGEALSVGGAVDILHWSSPRAHMDLGS